VLFRMPVAFGTTNAASQGAGVKHGADKLFLQSGAAACNGTRCGTNIGAVQIKSNALGQMLHFALTQPGVGARRAGLSAVVAFIDALDQGFVGTALYPGVGLYDLLRMHRDLLEQIPPLTPA
jgi:hypothetical protein